MTVVNDEIDWNAVIAVLNERFPLQLEIAILQSKVQALTATASELESSP